MCQERGGRGRGAGQIQEKVFLASRPVRSAKLFVCVVTERRRGKREGGEEKEREEPPPSEEHGKRTG